MRLPLAAAASLLALLLPTLGYADDADVEREILRVSQRVIDSSLKADVQTLSSLLCDDYVVVNPYGEITTRAEHLKLLEDGKLRFESTEPTDVRVRLHGDAAVLTARGRIKVMYQGQRDELTVRVTELFVKQGGGWKCASTQVTRIVEVPAGRP